MDFMVVGAQKAGTTTLYEILRRHPGIYLPVSKEDHFFDREANYSKGLEWYEKTFFPDVRQGQKRGVITPDYMFFENVPERIKDAYGENIKFVFILREPVSRAYSQYLMNRKRGVECRDFVSAVREELGYRGNDGHHKEIYSYLQKGFYVSQLQRYESHFGRENMKVLIYDDLYGKKKDESVQDVLRFIGVDMIPLETNFNANASSVYRFPRLMQWIQKDGIVKMLFRRIVSNKALRSAIVSRVDALNSVPVDEVLSGKDKRDIQQEYFLDEIRQLETYLGVDLSVWKA